MQHHGYGSCWPLTQKIIETMDTEVRTSGAEFLVVTIPAETCIYGTGLAKKTHTAAMSHLVALLDRTGVDYIDTTDRFAKEATGSVNRLHFPRDSHFTPGGHALMAELIKEHLEAKGWRQ